LTAKRLTLLLGISPVLLGILVVAFTNIVVALSLPLYNAPDLGRTPRRPEESDEPTLIVLGAGVLRREPSGMLKCRMNKALEVFARQPEIRILLSGDGTDFHYNETAAMRSYALQNGLPRQAVLSDPLGFSTYDSLRRAIEIFGIRKGIIVSQEFHLKRALWLAKSFGMDATALPCDKSGSSLFYQLREIPARSKDVFLRWFDFAPRSTREELF
jgi:SanA protein